MRRRWLLVISAVLIATGAAIAYSWWMKPYELPDAAPGITLEQYGMTFGEEARAQVVDLQGAAKVDALQRLVEQYPDNMAYSNELRITMASRGELDDFIAFAGSLPGDVPRLRLQIALAYVDQLQDPDLGTASLGQISSRSIEVVNGILATNPYDLLAHYARGLNNIYWPSGLRRTDKAIQDLAYCLAVAKQMESETDSPLWPLIYIAYGDALVKDGQIGDGVAVWKDGAANYPEHRELAELAKADRERALERVREVRGIDTFQRPHPELTDLAILWTTK